MQSEVLLATQAKRVQLVEQPDSCLSRHCKVTVGKIYEVLGSMGSYLVISTDVAGEDASIWRGRFKTVN